MKRPGLVLPTLIMLLLAGLLPALAGWYVRGRPAVTSTSGTSTERLSPEALQRWRTDEPHHWRACLLQQ
jgi:hypothetical protein